MKEISFAILIIASCIACKKQHATSFYFWETTYEISPIEKKYLDELNVQKLYVRFFDVDRKNNEAIPIGEINIKEKNTQQEIIPVVFITNDVLKNLDKNKIEDLAKHIKQEIEFIYPKISDKKIKEIQFDCDWTISTRSKYFYLLNIVEKQNPTLLVSATIRLHQIKDKTKTGIPPIKKGVLMYYATSNPLDFKEENSILENKLAENYCKEIQNYPIALDIALPIYSWAIIENQVGEKRLLNGIRNEMLKDTSIYQPIKPNFYLVKKDHYLHGNYIYEDFTIKTEEVTTTQLEQASTFLKNKIINQELNTIFYQLDSSNLSHYSIQNLKNISK